MHVNLDVTSSFEQQGRVLAPIAQIQSGLASRTAHALQLGSLDTEELPFAGKKSSHLHTDQYMALDDSRTKHVCCGCSAHRQQASI